MARQTDRLTAAETPRGRRLAAALAAAFPDDDAAAPARGEEALARGADEKPSGFEFVRAPGRVNLIGDHTDYNDGLVLPVAIDLDTWIAVRRRRDGLVRVASMQSPEASEFWIEDLEAGPGAVAVALGGATPAAGGAARDPRRGWSGHVAAMAWSLRESALPVRGFDGVIDSTIPREADLAWAAALELGSALALLAGERLVAAPALAALAQRAERDFLAADNGIVDQFAGAAGRAGRALLLDCRSLESRHVVLPAGVSVVVCDTGLVPDRVAMAAVMRERRAECGRAVALLAEEMPAVASLRDLDTPTLLRHRHLLSETVARRAEHVVAENERVVAAVSAFEDGDLDEIGRLFAASHESLRTLYEVSSPALDAMVDIARTAPGVLAARMTGAGLGGCTVNLVRDDAWPAFERTIAAQYPLRTGLTPRIYRVAVVDGAGSV